MEKRSCSYTSIGGSTAASPRTAVDFAVPFSPRTSTPPISALMVASTNASPIGSSASGAQPTMAVKG